jgi:3,4-dihydroxy-2-butanone 4-phosphate synthase
MQRYCLSYAFLKKKSTQPPSDGGKQQFKNQTAFTISIEAKEGVESGVSAKDRVTTIRTAVAADAQAEHIASPGHVFL